MLSPRGASSRLVIRQKHALPVGATHEIIILFITFSAKQLLLFVEALDETLQYKLLSEREKNA